MRECFREGSQLCHYNQDRAVEQGSPEELPKEAGKHHSLPQAQGHNNARPVVGGNQGAVQGMAEEEAKLDQLHAGDSLLDCLGHLHARR